MSQSLSLWLCEDDVVSLMDMNDAINVLEAGLLAEARGEAENMIKTHVKWGDHSTLHAIGAAFPREGFVGTKTWAHTDSGATPLLVLYDSENGSLKAIIEAFALGQLRTAAASGVATRCLAAEDCDSLAIVGTGRQALPQVAAVAAVRPLKLVKVFGRDPVRKDGFVRYVREELGLEAIGAPNVAACVADAPIITVATRATDAFLTGSMVARGSHINAVGAIVPTGAEIASDVLARASHIVADSPSQARRLSRELIEFFNQDEERWNRVQSLASLVAAGYRRQPEDDLTVFKSLGMGISDLALGIEIYRRALAAHRGRALDQPQRATPRLRRTVGTTKTMTND